MKDSLKFKLNIYSKGAYSSNIKYNFEFMNTLENLISFFNG